MARSSIKSRKRKRTPNKKAASASQGMAFPKTFTENRRAERSAADSAYRVKIRKLLFAGTKTCCVCKHYENPGGMPHEMHEAYSRAHTRMMEPKRRYDLRICVRVCHRCHENLTANLIALAFHSLNGAQGLFTWVVGPRVPEGYYSAEEVWRAAHGRR